VDNLPPEIISHIAQCLLDKDSVDTRWIIPLTHVCQYWRKSIISTPGNWTLVSSERIGLAKLSLERRSSVPLKLWLDMRRVKGNPVFSALFTPYIQNAGSLSINYVSSTGELVQTLRNFPQPMPNLRSMSLSGSASGTDPSGSSVPNLTHLLTRLSLTSIPLYPSFLRLSALTDLTLRNHRFGLHLDALLGFLDENRSLERATLEIRFTHPSLRVPWLRRVANMNQLRRLSIRGGDAMNTRALISSIALQPGAHLEIACDDTNARLNDILSGIPAAQLPNLVSPTCMGYQSCSRIIRLFGPNGSFSFENPPSLDDPFAELPLLPLTDIQELHLRHRKVKEGSRPPNLLVFRSPSFPALTTLAVDCETNISHLFSYLFSNRSPPLPLKTLAFLDCDLTASFMEKLARFASNRKRATSVRLHRIVIVNSKGNLPSVASIDALEKHVPVVHAQVGEKLPTDLS
jgi:hypothetical protein